MYDGLLLFKGKRKFQDIRDWLDIYQQKVDKAFGKLLLQFTAEIWTNEKSPPPSQKKDMVRKSATRKLPFLDMKMICHPKGDMLFVMFRKKGYESK